MAEVASVASSPGRVTVLGEHTDYNDGLALAVATTQRTTASLIPARDGMVRVASDALGRASCPIGSPAGPPFLTLAAALVAAAGLPGAAIEVTSTLPVGAGLSSSAAYAVAIALAAGLDGDPVELARACQAAEHLAGADVGLLDPLVVLCARPAAVVDLDFSTLTTAQLELSAEIGLSVVDTGVRRELSSSAYRQRRDECTAAAALLGPLGLLDERDAAQVGDPVLQRRARHVASECRRVRQARGALREGDLATLGALLDEGHASLRDDFDASTDAVERCRDAVRALPGVAGVRLTGGGFGGALVVAHEPDAVLDAGGRFCARLGAGEAACVSARPS